MAEQGTQDWGANPKPTKNKNPGIYATSGSKGEDQTKQTGTNPKAPGQHG